MHVELHTVFLKEWAFSSVVHLFLTRWLVQKNQNETKIKPCIDKSKTKIKRELHSWQRLRWGEKKQTNKNAFLQCLGPTLLSQEKAPNPSQLADTSSCSSMSTVSHCRMENPGSIFSQWACGFTLQPDLIILCFSTTVIPYSCLDAVDLYQTPHLVLCPQFRERLRPTLR